MGITSRGPEILAKRRYAIPPRTTKSGVPRTARTMNIRINGTAIIPIIV